MRRNPSNSALLSLLLLGACSAELDPAEAPATESPGGKADDFFSTTAFEFVVQGRKSITLEDSFADASKAERDRRVRELIGLEHISLTYFLTAYLVDKEKGDANFGFGGVGGMAKDGGYEALDIEKTGPLTWEFTFRQVVAGHGNLLERLPLKEDDEGEFFVLQVGTPTNEQLAELETDKEWFREAPFADWNPDAVDEKFKRELKLYISPDEPTPDAWLDFPAMFDDGVLSIDVHFGYDYHNQYHRKHARKVYEWLKNEMGYEAPATNFDDYHDTDRILRSTLSVPRLDHYDWCDPEAETCEVEVRVGLYWGMATRVCCEQADGTVSALLPGNCDGEELDRSECPEITTSPTDPDTNKGADRLESDFRESMRSADVIHFSGHAGPFFGFSLANWKKTAHGDVSYKEIESLELPDDRYQLFIADGCDTYQTAQAFARNPAKPDGSMIDVVTTTSFGDAELPFSVMNAILHLTAVDPEGQHRPRTVKSLMADLEAAMTGAPMFGVHFVADNPHLHPYADPSWTCEPCGTHSDCGAGGNRCVGAPEADEKACASACTSDDQCPDGTTCERIAATTAHAIYDHACVPKAFDCSDFEAPQ